MSKLKEIHAKRTNESLRPLFSSENEMKALFLTSSTDIGVIRNNGRNGAKYAPKSFLFQLKKMTQDESIKEWSFTHVEVSDEKLEIQDFKLSQQTETEKIKEALISDYNFITHIGGGHDHIYSFVSALKPDFKKIIVINIDAHADTRTDDEFHSGTPFRQLDSEIQNFSLYQIGLHPYSNSFSTLNPLNKEMSILWKQDCVSENFKKTFKRIQEEMDSQTLVIFSIDADALCGHQIPGVSAVNADGITLNDLKEIMDLYLKLPLKHSPFVGIYELNPVYDQLSGVSMNTMANFIFHSLRKCKG